MSFAGFITQSQRLFRARQVGLVEGDLYRREVFLKLCDQLLDGRLVGRVGQRQIDAIWSQFASTGTADSVFLSNAGYNR